MSSRVVSFRFLQAVTNPVTGDHATIGVLQWDGERLRFAGDSRKVSSDHGRSTIRRALTAIRAQIPRQLDEQSLLEDIREVFPVPEGEGSLLRWSDVLSGLATNPERHFDDLVRIAELADEAATPHVGRREITSALASLGESLGNKYGERVRVNTVVRNHFEYNSPLSWQNHTWHHTVSVNTDLRTPAELRKHMYQVMGIVNEAIPKTAGAVLAYVLPASNELVGDVERELNYIRSSDSNRIRLAPLTLMDDVIVAGVVEKMLIEDVAASS